MSICLPWPRPRRHASLSRGGASPRKIIDSVLDAPPLDASLGSEDYIFTVSGKRYIAPSSKKVKVPCMQSLTSRVDLTRRLFKDLALPKMKSRGPRLATVFEIPQDEADPWISKHLAEYKLNDVFSAEFLAVVVFIVPRESCVSKEEINVLDEIKILEENGMKEYIFVSSTDYSPGPHVIVDQELREVWKLVDDSYASCMVTLKPQRKYG